MTLRSIAIAGSILTAFTLAACSNDDDEPVADEDVAVLDADAPAMDADAPAMDPDAPAMEADPPAMEADPPAMAADMPFGGADDVAYANALWAALDEANLVGEQVIHAPFYEGAEPHGFVLETLFTDITVDGATGTAIVKRNYGPEGVTTEEVSNNPGDHLAAITVMYQRAGYNADNNDWFWVKWLADGTFDMAGETEMAGNVTGCIGCHADAPGGDWVFVTDRAL